jgi:hypothetical protein
VKSSVYQTGKSTETALHNVPTCIQAAVEHKEIAFKVFLNIGRLLTVPHLKHFMKPANYLDTSVNKVQRFNLSMG